MVCGFDGNKPKSSLNKESEMKILDRIVEMAQIVTATLFGVVYLLGGGFVGILVLLRDTSELGYWEYWLPLSGSIGALGVSPFCFLIAWVINKQRRERNEKEKKLEASSPAGGD